MAFARFAADSLAKYRQRFGKLSTDLTALSRDLKGPAELQEGETPEWLEGRVPGVHLLSAAVKLKESPREALWRLSRWAELLELELPEVDAERLDGQPPDSADLIVLSRNLIGSGPWLEARVPVAHLLAAAAKLNESPSEVLRRLSRWAELLQWELPEADAYCLDNQPFEPADITV
ncbi:MAG: hypothetical protein GY953_47340, partial [bacterium]|nr:hypothetical protein [bacterium]